ncbi:hypothetical protein HK104_004814 [Borealophlyctis nickersoniae]|nr:hypothetical protein HK104_004814 [Borealophlyctis nickersoniae]
MSKAASVNPGFIRLLIPAGKAAPAPPVGPALGQRGIKSMDFCKQFNERTKHFTPSVPIPTKIFVQPNKTYTFVTSAPPTSYLLKKAAGIEKGSGRTGSVEAGTVSVKHIYEIAKIKSSDPQNAGQELQKVASSIVGTARSMGIKVVY